MIFRLVRLQEVVRFNSIAGNALFQDFNALVREGGIV